MPSWLPTAVKHAVDGRGVAHLVLPDEVQDLPSDAPAASPRGRRADLAGARHHPLWTLRSRS